MERARFGKFGAVHLGYEISFSKRSFAKRDLCM
jgi:hypothetical protein